VFVTEGDRFTYKWQGDPSSVWMVDILRNDGDYDCVVIQAEGLNQRPDVLKRARFSCGQIESCVFLYDKDRH